MNEIIEKIKYNFFDYNNIKSNNIVILQNTEEIYDINFFITARGRIDFSQPIFDSFNQAREKSNLNICYTLIEHSESPTHSKICKKNKTNYIWIKSRADEPFNKCLSYNMGALFSNKAKYYLFHDIDILIQSDFFNKLVENINRTKAKALQCFTQRRVLYCNSKITKNLIEKEINVDSLNLDMEDINLPILGGKVMIGAPGGSILVERDLFFEVGGYDAELFKQYSPEDAFFWDKLSNLTTVHTSDNPEIEVFHMYHSPSYQTSPDLYKMELIYEKFKNLSKEQKMEIINLKKELFKKYKN
jgi:hypothetical protein